MSHPSAPFFGARGITLGNPTPASLDFTLNLMRLAQGEGSENTETPHLIIRYKEEII